MKPHQGASPAVFTTRLHSSAVLIALRIRTKILLFITSKGIIQLSPFHSCSASHLVSIVCVCVCVRACTCAHASIFHYGLALSEAMSCHLQVLFQDPRSACSIPLSQLPSLSSFKQLKYYHLHNAVSSFPKAQLKLQLPKFFIFSPFPFSQKTLY